jgi:glutamate racemase
MAKIVVFDSGFGSLSIIKAIQKVTKAQITYFADQKNFPYGKKTPSQLNKIINNTIRNLRQKFKPDLIVIASNTPSILLDNLFDDRELVGVTPPLLQASKYTKTKSIGILATTSVVKSKALDNYIVKNIGKEIKITKIDASELVDLVESGKFIYNKEVCMKKIKLLLTNTLISKNIDVVTLSSTHLPFLLELITKNFPHIKFLDPADGVAYDIRNNKFFSPSKKNSLKIFSNGNTKQFQNFLKNVGIKTTVKKITF